MVFLGGEGGVVGVEGEGECGNAFGLPESGVGDFCFHINDIL